MSICDLRLNTGKDGTTEFGNLKSNSFYRRVPPGEHDLTSSDGDPGTNGVISKTRCGVRIKRVSSTLQPSVGAHLLNQQFLLTPRLQAGGKSQHEIKAYRAQVSPS